MVVYTPVVIALGRLKEKDWHEFESNLGHNVTLFQDRKSKNKMHLEGSL